MVSGSEIRTQIPGDCVIQEDRPVDTPALRMAELTGWPSASSIAAMRDRLIESVDDFNVRSGVSRTQFCAAVEEALANAFYHGNLEVDSCLKQGTSSAFNGLVRHRSMRSPWKERCVRVTELATPFGIWITISDEGAGYDAAAALSCNSDPSSLLESGRGLIMMRAFTDDLFFNESGNQVTLVFYRDRKNNSTKSTGRRMNSHGFEPLQQSIL